MKIVAVLVFALSAKERALCFRNCQKKMLRGLDQFLRMQLLVIHLGFLGNGVIVRSVHLLGLVVPVVGVES